MREREARAAIDCAHIIAGLRNNSSEQVKEMNQLTPLGEKRLRLKRKSIFFLRAARGDARCDQNKRT
jgi:hypothetical protein